MTDIGGYQDWEAIRIADKNRHKPGGLNSVASKIACLTERILDDSRSRYKTTTGIPINIYYIAKLKVSLEITRIRTNGEQVIFPRRWQMFLA